jgi:hypothetical protein
MKKKALLIWFFLMTVSYGQESKQVPQITVNGEGKIKAARQATITAL